MKSARKIHVLIVAKPWHGGLHQYYVNAFKRSGICSVKIIYSYPNTFKEYLRYKLNKKLWLEKKIEEINLTNYDLGFFINTEEILSKVLKNNNYLYLTDNPSHIKIKSNNINKIFLSDIGYLKKMKAQHNNIEELAFGIDPFIHKSHDYHGTKKPICSIMNKDYARDELIKALLDRSFKLDIYGNYFFKHKFFFKNPLLFHPPVPFTKQGNVYSKYLISLNIHAGILRNGTNMRTFELCGYKLAQIVNFRPGLENFFEPGKEIMIFSEIEECIDKFKMILKDKKIYNKLIEASNKRALSHHTYDIRVKQILFDYL